MGGTVCLGNFDGVHLGHRYVIDTARIQSNGRPCIALSFYPHPIRVLKGTDDPKPITSEREKLLLFGDLGVDLAYLVHFTMRTAAMDARSFISDVLVRSLGAKELVVGQDAAIGRGREGDVSFLKRALPEYGITLRVVEELQIGGTRPSSRKVRQLVETGALREAAALLGHTFFISARVGPGDGRGRTIGFPTANLVVTDHLLPAKGVYACRVDVGGTMFPAVTNVGVRPTFGGEALRAETHLLDFPRMSLYGKRIVVHFLERIRDERRFESIEALVSQITLDCATARRILSHE
jgi:riboflavin kinase/FMN adenylyltransferase